MSYKEAGRTPRAEKTTGRKSLIDSDEWPSIAAEFIRCRKLGLGIEDSCNCAGISDDVYYEYLKLAERADEDPEYERFAVFAKEASRARSRGNSELADLLSTALQEGRPVFDKDGIQVGRQLEAREIRATLAVRSPDSFASTNRVEVRGKLEPLQVEIIMSDGVSGDDAPESEPSGT